MDKHPEREALIRRYLLGDVSEDDAERVEQMLLTDQQEYECAKVLEDELVDDYVQGTLGEDERLSFEKKYLVSEDRRKSLLFARVLRSYAAAQTVPVGGLPARERNSDFGWQFAHPFMGGRTAGWVGSIAIVIIVASVFLVQRTWVLKAKLEQEQKKENAILQSAEDLRVQLRAEIEHKKTQQGGSTGEGVGTASNEQSVLVASIVLTPGISRGATGIMTLVLPENAGFVEFDLRVGGGNHDEYRVLLSDAAGKEIAMQGRLKRLNIKDGTIVPVRLAATGLLPGQYSLRLEALDGRGEFGILGTYYVQINRHP